MATRHTGDGLVYGGMTSTFQPAPSGQVHERFTFRRQPRSRTEDNEQLHCFYEKSCAGRELLRILLIFSCFPILTT